MESPIPAEEGPNFEEIEARPILEKRQS